MVPVYIQTSKKEKRVRREEEECTEGQGDKRKGTEARERKGGEESKKRSGGDKKSSGRAKGEAPLILPQQHVLLHKCILPYQQVPRIHQHVTIHNICHLTNICYPTVWF